MDTPESVPRAREKYEHASKILKFEDIPQELCERGFADLLLPTTAYWGGESLERVELIARTFCIPKNPLWDVFKFRIETNLEKIYTCRNVAGIKRTLQAYATPLDAAALVEAIASGGSLDNFIPSTPPPFYRYSVLVERTRLLIQSTSQFESYLLSVLEKLDAKAYTLQQARNDLKLSQENISLHSLRVNRAEQSMSLAELQKEKTQVSYDHYNDLVAAGFSGLEIAALVMMGVTAAGHAVAAGLQYYAGNYAGGASSTAAATSTIGGMLSTFAAFERRAQEWNYQRDLANKDLEIADQSIAISKTDVEITEKERNIAIISSELSADTVELLINQFTSYELYYWMKKELKKLHRSMLNMAHNTARSAQQALMFELQQPLSYIGFLYYDEKYEGLLGAEKLLFDLERMEEYRIGQSERRREITEVFSLASLMPAEFQLFRQTGLLDFATPAYIYDKRAPGEYQRLIKSVEVSLNALIPAVSSIRATFTNHGISRVMTGSPFAESTVIQRPPETVSLSSATKASGLFELRLNDPVLLPFEGSGTDTSWSLELLQGANDFDFNTISDVLITIRYTAKDDWGYRQKVITALQESYMNTAAASSRYLFPSSWYEFHNPRFYPAYALDGSQPLPPYTVVLELTRDRFPPSERNHSIRQVVISFDMTNKYRVPINVYFQPDGGAQVDAVNKEIVNGRVSLHEFDNREPYGKWIISINTSADVTIYPEVFDGMVMVGTSRKINTENYNEILLVVEYNAELLF
jgi:hypothetical protein